MGLKKNLIKRQWSSLKESRLLDMFEFFQWVRLVRVSETSNFWIERLEMPSWNSGNGISQCTHNMVKFKTLSLIKLLVVSAHWTGTYLRTKGSCKVFTSESEFEFKSEFSIGKLIKYEHDKINTHSIRSKLELNESTENRLLAYLSDRHRNVNCSLSRIWSLYPLDNEVIKCSKADWRSNRRFLQQATTEIRPPIYFECQALPKLKTFIDFLWTKSIGLLLIWKSKNKRADNEKMENNKNQPSSTQKLAA